MCVPTCVPLSCISQVADAEHYSFIMSERATPWGEEPAQPLERCLAHTFSLIFRYIQRTKRGGLAAAKTPAERTAERSGRAAPSTAPGAASPADKQGAETLTEADIKMWFASHKAELSKLGA